MRAKRRFAAITPKPDHVLALALDHPAVTGKRTIFPKMVVSAEASPRLLVSGANSRKLGDRVTKGAWRGFPIYQLTLEERATCPRSCFHWLTCYGNALHLARRHSHEGGFLAVLDTELAGLQRAHPAGFVVRLHVLGDFFSVDYVAAWARFLRQYPALHAFGYSAWQPETPVGEAVRQLADAQWDRFAIRTTDALAGPRCLTIWRHPEANVVPEGIVCPAETGATDCCGTCGLCWAAPSKTVVFVAHGPTRGRRKGTLADRQWRNRRILARRAARVPIDDIALEFGLGRSTVVKVIEDAKAKMVGAT